MFELTLNLFLILPGDDKDTSVSSSEDDSESTSIPSSDGRKVKHIFNLILALFQ